MRWRLHPTERWLWCGGGPRVGLCKDGALYPKSRCSRCAPHAPQGRAEGSSTSLPCWPRSGQCTPGSHWATWPPGLTAGSWATEVNCWLTADQLLGQPLVNHWPTIGHHWSMAGQPLVNHWTTIGQPLVNCWTTTGQPLDNHWTDTGQPLDRLLVNHWINHWSTTGQLLDNSWSTIGQPLDRCWSTTGSTVG